MADLLRNGGRFRSQRVAGLLRNRWPVWLGIRSSALRPFLDALDDRAREAFREADYTARIARAILIRYDGKVLLRFPRLFDRRIAVVVFLVGFELRFDLIGTTKMWSIGI